MQSTVVDDVGGWESEGDHSHWVSGWMDGGGDGERERLTLVSIDVVPVSARMDATSWGPSVFFVAVVSRCSKVETSTDPQLGWGEEAVEEVEGVAGLAAYNSLKMLTMGGRTRFFLVTKCP